MDQFLEQVVTKRSQASQTIAYICAWIALILMGFMAFLQFTSITAVLTQYGLGVERYNEKQHPELDALLGRELGYVLNRDYWGQGLMPEAVRAVTAYLFEGEALDFLIAGSFEWNRQSARVLEKCGFECIGGVPSVTTYLKVEWCLDYILYNPRLRRD